MNDLIACKCVGSGSLAENGREIGVEERSDCKIVSSGKRVPSGREFRVEERLRVDAIARVARTSTVQDARQR